MDSGRSFLVTIGLAAGLAVALPAGLARADTKIIRADDAVPGHPGVSYLDLVRQVVPDLAANDAAHDIEGHLTRDVRHVAGKDYEGDPPDPVVLGWIEDQRIKVGGRSRIAILADLGANADRAQDTALLMLFDDAPKPRLLDVVDVGMDKDSSFAERAKLPLGPGDDALITYSEHFNSNQTYGIHLIVLVRRDRLQLVRDVFTLSSRACGWEEQEPLTITTRPDPGRPYRAIDVGVRVETKRNGEDCGEDADLPKPRSLRFRVQFRWNKARRRFEPSSDALDRLWKLNQASL